MPKSIVFIDSEIGLADNSIQDLGAVRNDGQQLHTKSVRQLADFVSDADFICGHNLIHHDLEYLGTEEGVTLPKAVIDTLYLSPLLFPDKTYHALPKDDKLLPDRPNNPLNDALKAQLLFDKELSAFAALPAACQSIYYGLLREVPEFRDFFVYVGYKQEPRNLPALIHQEFRGQICEHADIEELIRAYPAELAYSLALIRGSRRNLVTGKWLKHNYPHLEPIVMRQLRNTPCGQSCDYCSTHLSIHRNLQAIFGFDEFRTYDDEPLQERATQAAVDGKSLLAVFPTGGGKSLAFQLPALMAGNAENGLTVVLSPLLSLMKDQVDHLEKLGITNAVTINGQLNPLERASALRRVTNGHASLLYIAPEQLRSRTIMNMLLERNVVRFVIDEAHCISAWGQDFRVDYLAIADFIRSLQEQKGLRASIPVSCFTATARKRVVEDIIQHFQQTLNLELDVFVSNATRDNLHYSVQLLKEEKDKFLALRILIEQTDCPVIVYVARTRRSEEIALGLSAYGVAARPFHGKMSSADKTRNQEMFMRNEIRVIVATSAFGMGVDKADVGLVVHYDIPSSLEDYLQEAGRAGRDPSAKADCCMLYTADDSDLDQHFQLLNLSKLSQAEIDQLWRAIKKLADEGLPTVHTSALELARLAGWPENALDIETRVKTGLSVLERTGYIRRGYNVARVHASSICVDNMLEASELIDRSPLFDESQKMNAKRIMSRLLTSRSIAVGAGDERGETRVDYLADMLELSRHTVTHTVALLRQAGILADWADMAAGLPKSKAISQRTVNQHEQLERFILEQITHEERSYSLKVWNNDALECGIASSTVAKLRTSLNFLSEWQQIEMQPIGNGMIRARTKRTHGELQEDLKRRKEICSFVLDELFELAKTGKDTVVLVRQNRQEETVVSFSLVGLHRQYIQKTGDKAAQLRDMEGALLYLSRIGAARIEGGFLVSYNGMEITRLEMNNRTRFKKADYETLDNHYKQKIQRIHVVGEYAHLMQSDTMAAQQFVKDYFQMDFRKFVKKHFSKERMKEIERSVTPNMHNQLFSELSTTQKQIIDDAESKCIVVTAAPGSGKTRVLVHKLASLLLMEDVKQEQLLMLTFTRAAATEFKKRLIELIGDAAKYVEVKTFHSFSLDLLGRRWIKTETKNDDENRDNVLASAAEMIERGEAEPLRLAKTVIVVDEAQDMDEHAFHLVQALMHWNEDNRAADVVGIRLIAVGDDDQNIFEFCGSDSRYMRSMIEELGGRQYQMTANYRSSTRVVAMANAFAEQIRNRMKTSSIVAIRSERGEVRINLHSDSHLEHPVVEKVAAAYRDGSTCVLTTTNEEALTVLGMLVHKGVPAKLIQAMDTTGFNLYNLAEVRYFLKKVQGESQDAWMITDDAWTAAKNALRTTYADSTCLDVCLNMLNEYEQTCGDAT